jgi:hypothetical protein
MQSLAAEVEVERAALDQRLRELNRRADETIPTRS